MTALSCKLSYLRSITGKSNSFIVYPGSSSSSVGLLRKTSIAMEYDGPFQVVQGIVEAFNVSDCPAVCLVIIQHSPGYPGAAPV